jgi:23S rRNA pseudouridine955/2504/2580 synthase
LKKNFITQSDNFDIRLDKWLRSNFSSLNQSFIEKNIRKGNIKVNNKKVTSKYKLQIKDEVIIFNYSKEIYLHQKEKLAIKKIPSKYNELFNSNIVYQDDNFIILNKWTGIATQGGSKINISIDDIIKNISNKYNLVHRLDRETSGILIIAKDMETTKYFGKLFREHLIKKIYVAICQGSPKNQESEINLSIPDKRDSSKVSKSITSYKVYQTNNNLSNIIFLPKTGKTHQIRIVAKHLGCPIVGDSKYNIQNKYNFEKLKLNAHILNFTFNNKDYEFISKLPDHFTKLIKKNDLKKINLKNIKDFL